MTASPMPTGSRLSLENLLGFLEHDPGNARLIGDAAIAAFDEDRLSEASYLLGRYETVEPLGPAQLNLKGLIALKEERFADAAEVFGSLHATAPNETGLRFNLAWAKSATNDSRAVFDLLDDATVAAVPRAGGLKIHAMHHLGMLDEALVLGESLVERRPDDKALMGALALIATDAEQVDLARHYAAKAGDHPDGVSTQALLMLNEQKVDGSLAMFDKALDVRPDNPRALLGKGLGLMLKGDAAVSADHIDRAAEIFQTHLGSWVSAGWVHFMKGDHAASRERFERAMAIDDTFAETHGGLAVLDIAENQLDSARKRVDIALRLDRQCLSAALAKSLLLEAEGKARSAEKVRKAAMNQPIGVDGQTIAQSIVAFGMAPEKQGGEDA